MTTAPTLSWRDSRQDRSWTGEQAGTHCAGDSNVAKLLHSAKARVHELHEYWLKEVFTSLRTGGVITLVYKRAD